MKSSDSSDSIPRPSVKRLEDPRTWWTVTVVIAVAGLAVRAGFLGESLWVDELHSAWTVSGSWSEVADRAAQGNNLPTYFWLLHAVSSIAGHSETTLRLPSLIMSLAVLIGMAWIVRRWTNNAIAGWIAAACMMLDRDFIFFSVEARPYAAVQLVTAGLLAITPTLALAPTGPRRALAVGLQAVAFYLHPTAVLAWPAVILARLACARWRTFDGRPPMRPTILATTVDSALLLLLLLPSTPVLLEIFQRRNNWQSIPALAPSSASLTRAIQLLHLGIYALIPAVGWLATWLVCRGCAPPSNSDPITPTPTPTTPTSPPIVDRRAPGTLEPAASSENRPWHRHLLRASLLSCWLWAIIPLGLVLLTTRLGWAPLLMLRYIWSAKLGAVCGASIGVTALPSRICRLIASTALIVCVAWQLGPGSLGAERICEHWHEALTTIAQLDPDGRDIVLIRSKLIEAGYLDSAANTANDVQHQAWRTYLAFPLDTQTYPLPHSAARKIPLNNDLSPSLSESDRQLLAPAPSVWLVARGARDETQSVLEAIERQLPDSPSSWHRSVDSSGPCLRLVRWTRAARESRE